MPISFSYPPLRGAKKIIKWQVAEVSFGSGYHSATALGRDVRWQAGFIVECLEDLHSLVNAFVEAKGVDTLLWTPPSHSQSEFVLNDWKVTPLRNDAYRIDVDLKLIEVTLLDGDQHSDPYYTAHGSPIQVLDLAAQFGSTQTTRVRNISLQYANQYQQRNYDDKLRSVFESWDVQANGLSSKAAAELDAFLDRYRGEKPFKWDDGVCVDVGGGGGAGGIAADGTGEGGHADHYYKCREWEFEYLVGEVEGVEECLNGVVNFKATFDQCYGIYIKELPDPPTNLTATASYRQIYLSWSTVNAVSYYTLQRSNEPNGPYQIIAYLLSNDYLDTGLRDGTTYYYRVIAHNTKGESFPSNVAEDTTAQPRVTYGWVMGYWTMGISSSDATYWRQIPGEQADFGDPFDEYGCYCLMKNEQGKIVAVGYNGRIERQLDPNRTSGGLINAAVSEDGGLTWRCVRQLVPRSQGGTYSEGGTYGNGVFVIAGDNGHLWTSSDGYNWTTRYGFGVTPYNRDAAHDSLTNDKTSQDYHTCAAFGNNTFLAGSDTGVIRRSTDNGVTWQIVWVPYTYQQRLQGNYTVRNYYRIKSFAYGNGRWVAIVGWNERAIESDPYPPSMVLSSTDNGDTWQNIQNRVPVTGHEDYFGGEVRFIQGRFYFAGDDGKIATSSDGINWALMPNNPLEVTTTAIYPERPGYPAYEYLGTISALAYNSSQNIILFARGDGVLAIYDLATNSWRLIANYWSDGEGFLERFADSPLSLVESGIEILPASMNLTAIFLCGSAVGLTWDAVNSTEFYSVKRSTSSGGTYTTIASRIDAADFGNDPSISYLDTTTENGQDYYYVVTANNSIGVSLHSNEAQAYHQLSA